MGIMSKGDGIIEDFLNVGQLLLSMIHNVIYIFYSTIQTIVLGFNRLLQLNVKIR